VHKDDLKCTADSAVCFNRKERIEQKGREPDRIELVGRKQMERKLGKVRMGKE